MKLRAWISMPWAYRILVRVQGLHQQNFAVRLRNCILIFPWFTNVLLKLSVSHDKGKNYNGSVTSGIPSYSGVTGQDVSKRT